MTLGLEKLWRGARTGKQSDYHRNLHTELPLLSVFKVIFKMAFFFFFKIRITPSVTERLIYVSANILG